VADAPVLLLACWRLHYLAVHRGLRLGQRAVLVGAAVSRRSLSYLYPVGEDEHAQCAHRPDPGPVTGGWAGLLDGGVDKRRIIATVASWRGSGLTESIDLNGWQAGEGFPVGQLPSLGQRRRNNSAGIRPPFMGVDEPYAAM